MSPRTYLVERTFRPALALVVSEEPPSGVALSAVAVQGRYDCTVEKTKLPSLYTWGRCSAMLSPLYTWGRVYVLVNEISHITASRLAALKPSGLDCFKSSQIAFKPRRTFLLGQDVSAPPPLASSSCYASSPWRTAGSSCSPPFDTAATTRGATSEGGSSPTISVSAGDGQHVSATLTGGEACQLREPPHSGA